MKILVTGGAGYIGSHTCKLLEQTGHEVTVFDNLSTGHHYLAQFGKFIKGDIRNLYDLDRAMNIAKPDAVIHFAASAYVGESTVDPVKYYQNNVGGTANLVQAMAEHNVKNIVFSSSCATYGLSRQNRPMSELTRQEPVNPYGRTKLICETLLKDVAGTGAINATALRYFNAAGADAGQGIGEIHDPETHVIPLLLVALKNKTAFKIFGDTHSTHDGTCVRDYLHVTDLAQGHLLALEALIDKPHKFEAYNLGTGTGTSVREMVKKAEELTRLYTEIVVEPKRIGDPPYLVADYDKAYRDLGWLPQHSSIENIISTAWKWLHAPSNPYRLI